MISQISWTSFLTATAIILFLYYGIVALACYRRRIYRALCGGNYPIPPSMNSQPSTRRNLMGTAKEDPDIGDYLLRYQPQGNATSAPQPSLSGTPGIIGADEEESSRFLVASLTDDAPVVEMTVKKDLSPDGLLVGNVADLMDSVTTLLRIIEDGKGDRDDICGFFPSLLAQYPTVAESKYRYSVNQFIHDRCKAALNADMTIDEINGLWEFQRPQQAA